MTVENEMCGTAEGEGGEVRVPRSGSSVVRKYFGCQASEVNQEQVISKAGLSTHTVKQLSHIVVTPHTLTFSPCLLPPM